MIRKFGFYWVKEYYDDPWVIAKWNGRSWHLFGYRLSTLLEDKYIDIVGPHIPEPVLLTLRNCVTN